MSVMEEKERRGKEEGRSHLDQPTSTTNPRRACNQNIGLWVYIIVGFVGGMAATVDSLTPLVEEILEAFRRFADRGVDSARLWLNILGIDGTASTPDASHAILRHGIPPLPMWVDAICINQAYLSEKNHQIDLMGRIYSQSETTLMWLGLQDATSSATMSLVGKMSRDIIRSGDTHSYSWLADPAYDQLLARFAPHDPVEAIKDLFMERPYWSRAWTLQDMALSKSVSMICGHDTCNLRSALGSLAIWSPELRHPTPGTSDQVWKFATELRKNRFASPSFDLLNKRHMEALRGELRSQGGHDAHRALHDFGNGKRATSYGSKRQAL